MLAQYLYVALCFVFDGIAAAIFPIDFANVSISFVPCFGLCALVLSIREMDFTNAMIMSVFFGVYYDFIYANTFLVYEIVFALVCLIVKYWTKHLGDSLIELIVMCCVTIFMKEMIAYIIMVARDATTMDLSSWFINRIFLTIIVNAVFVYFLAFMNSFKETYIRNREARIRKEEKLFIYKGRKM